jgi:hypothetical protein
MEICWCRQTAAAPEFLPAVRGGELEQLWLLGAPDTAKEVTAPDGILGRRRIPTVNAKSCQGDVRIRWNWHGQETTHVIPAMGVRGQEAPGLLPPTEIVPTG